MACFTAPAAVAVVTTILRKRIPERYHINWLNAMLWGGTAGLALEHVAHGEIVFYPPYLTAMKSAEETAVMIHEIMTTGVMMLVACVALWAVMVCVDSFIEERTKAKTSHTA